MKRCFLGVVFLLVLMCFTAFRSNMVVGASDISSEVNAKSYIVIDNNNKVLFGNNYESKREVASICKLMTTLIALEKIDSGELKLDDKIYVSHFAASMEGSQAFLDGGKEYTLEDLLKSIIIASANDSAVAVAESIGGSEKSFVSMMNSRARALGMNNTLYANATGLSTPEQYSTAYDTALLLKELDKYSLYHKYSGVWLDHIIHSSGRKTELVNTNRNIRYYEYCEMGKTGFTDEAGYCLASKNTKGELTIYTVVLGCSSSASRFTDSMKLSSFAFANYSVESLVSKGENVENNVRVTRGAKDSISLSVSDDYLVTKKVGSDDSYSIKYSLPETIEAEIKKGDIIGQVLVIENSIVIGEVNIIAEESIARETYGDVLDRVIQKFAFVN